MNLIYSLENVPVSKIDVWKEAQARTLDKDGILELAKSIDSEGLQSPPLVKKTDNRYLLFTGQRRLAAIKILKKTTIPVLILNKNITIEDAKAASLIENIHRKGMDKKDISIAIKYLIDTVKSKIKIAKMLGMSPRTLRRYMGFDSIPEPIKELVPEKISRDNAVKIYRIIPNISDVIIIINNVSRLEKNLSKKYIQELAKNPKTTHNLILKKIKKENNVLIKIKLSKKQLSFITKENKKSKHTQEEILGKIIKIGITNY